MLANLLRTFRVLREKSGFLVSHRFYSVKSEYFQYDSFKTFFFINFLFLFSWADPILAALESGELNISQVWIFLLPLFLSYYIHLAQTELIQYRKEVQFMEILKDVLRDKKLEDLRSQHVREIELLKNSFMKGNIWFMSKFKA